MFHQKITFNLPLQKQANSLTMVEKNCFSKLRLQIKYILKKDIWECFHHYATVLKQQYKCMFCKMYHICLFKTTEYTFLTYWTNKWNISVGFELGTCPCARFDGEHRPCHHMVGKTDEYISLTAKCNKCSVSRVPNSVSREKWKDSIAGIQRMRMKSCARGDRKEIMGKVEGSPKQTMASPCRSSGFRKNSTLLILTSQNLTPEVLVDFSTGNWGW